MWIENSLKFSIIFVDCNPQGWVLIVGQDVPSAEGYGD